jgi:phosphoenolpyruvate-protein phosphotransferase (PTS system enzyme I)
MTALEKTRLPQDIFLVGIAASPGIAIGSTYLLDRSRTLAVERPVTAADVPAEIRAFQEAVQLSRQQLEEVKDRVADRQLAEHLYIIDTHLLILEDKMLLDATVEIIEGELINAEGALKRVLQKFRNVFDSIEDEYLRERRSDIDSVGDRLLRNLRGERQASVTGIDRQAVIVAHDLSPADTMQMDKERIIGFLTDVGGRTSHTAILSRSLGIPAVVGLENVTSLLDSGLPIIVDGGSGTVILNPSPATIQEYQRRQEEHRSLEKELLNYRELPAQTLDGCRLALRGNVEVPEEVAMALCQGAEGVGLFRSEFLFMNRPTSPSEEEQYLAFRNIAEQMAPYPVTIRTLDVGGDKFVPEINLVGEANPAMGLRGVRFSLKEVRLLKVQLRAILRASAHGRLRLMIPMVCGVGEIRSCKDYLQEAMAELAREGHPFDAALPVGVMIETPAAALIPDLLAREVDFFSVGTNDLIQYCLAVDRGNEHVAYLYQPLHPALLRALRNICAAARTAGIEVGMCGEMASEPLYTLVLLGLGFEELSMNAHAIPLVKRLLRQARREDGEALLEALLRCTTAEEGVKFLEEEMGRRFPEFFVPPTI